MSYTIGKLNIWVLSMILELKMSKNFYVCGCMFYQGQLKLRLVLLYIAFELLSLQ